MTMPMDTVMYLAMCFDRNATRSSTVNSTAAPVDRQEARLRTSTGMQIASSVSNFAVPNERRETR